MWLGNEPSNWGTNSQPARTTETLKACTPESSPTRADYPIKGLQQHPVKDAPGSDNSKYLKFPYPSSKSGEAETGQNIHRLETFQNSEIDPKYHNQQLEHVERIEKYTLLVKFGRERERER
ncbi:unnamed protein product [Prunus brigantina]